MLRLARVASDGLFHGGGRCCDTPRHVVPSVSRQPCVLFLHRFEHLLLGILCLLLSSFLFVSRIPVPGHVPVAITELGLDM